MSSSLYWRPPPRARKENSLFSLKHTLSKYLDPDWNGGGYTEMVGDEIIPFLKGLIAACELVSEVKINNPLDPKSCIEEAQSLIDGINQYGQVEISLHS